MLLEDHRVELAPTRDEPPVIDLDADYYKLVGDFEPRFPAGPPSLVECERLTVSGDVTFGAASSSAARSPWRGRRASKMAPN